MNAKVMQNASPREMGETELTAERDRLEGDLKAGKLTVMEGSRLALIRRCLRRLQELNVGDMRQII